MSHNDLSVVSVKNTSKIAISHIDVNASGLEALI